MLGRRSNNYPVINNKEVDVTLQCKWKTVQAATNVFWSLWIQEYLSKSTKWKKWLLLNTNLKNGDLVLLYNKNLKQSKWPVWRIVETVPRTDNAVLLKYKWRIASFSLLECLNDQFGVVWCIISRYNSSLLGWQCFVICVWRQW